MSDVKQRIADICEVADTPRLRHFLFARWVLGEPDKNAIWFAIEFTDAPITAEAMEFIAERWSTV